MMERESAVREILRSIGPLFPEDAQRARDARRQAERAQAAPATDMDSTLEMSAPKPVLASQVDGPDTHKTQVASLAAVLERLTPPPPPPSVRDTIPELVRIAPEVNALRAALDERRDAPAPRPDAELPSAPVMPSEPPVVAIAPEPAAPDAVVAADTDVTAPEPVATEIDLEAAPVEPPEPELEAAAAPEPTPEIATASEAAPELATEHAHFTTFSEDEHDAFVAAVAEALQEAREAEQASATPAPEADAAGAPEPAPQTEAAPEPAPAVTMSPAAPRRVRGKAQPKRGRSKAQARSAVKSPSRPAPPQSAPVPAVPAPGPDPEPQAGAGLREDDELIRQIRTHRADLIDVDDQLARLDQEIAVDKERMAHFVALVAQKNAYRDRLVRLRTSTQRFVDTLQIKAEPPQRRTPRDHKKRKSA